MADNTKFVAVKVTRLSASITSSDTSATLAVIQDRAGNTLTMTDFGTTGYGVFEPGTAREEHFSFTGISSTTISGITRGLAMKDPYTNVSANQKAHSAGTKVILYTNSPALYSQFVLKNNDESITGVHTFAEAAVPRISASHTYGAGEEEYLATKRYADSLAIAGAPDGSTTQKGIYEAATQTEADDGDDTGTTTAPTVLRPSVTANAVQRGVWVKFTETASGDDDYTATTSPSFTPALGSVVLGSFATANTAGATFALNGEAPVAIQKVVAGALAALETGDIIANVPLLLYRTASVWVLLSPGGTTPTTAILSEMSTFFSNTDITGSEAETLTSGAANDATSLHTHKTVKALAHNTTMPGDTNENTLLSYTVPANRLGTKGGIRIKLRFTHSGNTFTTTGRIKFGATTIYTYGAVDPGATVNNVVIDMEIWNNGATNAQISQHDIISAAGTAGNGTTFQYLGPVTAGGTAAIDTTSSTAVAITFQKSNAAAVIIASATIELLDRE